MLPESEIENLTEREKQALAWREVLNRVMRTAYHLTSVIVMAVALLTIAYLLYLAMIWVYRNDLLAPAAVFVLISAAALGITLYQRKVYSELFERSASSWSVNKGDNPGYERVSIERTGGEIEWNRVADELDWSLHADNPIRTFIPKNK